MSKSKTVTKKEILTASVDTPKIEEPSKSFQEGLIARLEGFEEKMNLLQEENRLLNEQIKMKSTLGRDPLAYANGVEPKSIEAPNVIPSYSAKLMKAMESDDRMVEGKFEYKEITRPKEAKGATVSFHFRKYPGKPVKRYTLMHGVTYKLSIGVANHINGELDGCKYSIHRHVMDEKTGEQRIDNGSEVNRLGFHNVAFM